MACSHWAPPPLIPPFRFGTVEHEVYRGAYPKQRNLRFLKRLKLKTVLSLIPDAVDNDFLQFCEEQGIRWIHLPVDKVKDNVPLSYSRTVEAIQVIIDPDNMPIYIHCLDGACVTGLVIACIRKLQTWNISSALGELLRYLRGGVISSEESVFVEKFSSEIEIARPIPPWLWEGQIHFKRHPTLKITFKGPPEHLSAACHPRYSTTAGATPSLASSSQHPPAPHVAFAASGPQATGTGGRTSRHHHSSSSVSSVLGFQPFSDRGFAGPSAASFADSNSSSTCITTIAEATDQPNDGGGDAVAKDPALVSTEGRPPFSAPSAIQRGAITSTSTSTSAIAAAAGTASSSSSSSSPPPGMQGTSFSAAAAQPKDPLNPRLTRTKSTVRTELGSQRPTSVSTPTTSFMKEARGRRPSLLHGQSSTGSVVSQPAAAAGGGGGGGGGTAPQGQPTTAEGAASVSASSSATSMSILATGAAGGTGGTNTGIPSSSSSSPSSSQAAVGRSKQDGEGSQSTTGLLGESGGSGPTTTATTAASDVPSSTTTTTTNRLSPMPPAFSNDAASGHVRRTSGVGESSGSTDPRASGAGASNAEADEYYDVSLTLKALSLEGADW